MLPFASTFCPDEADPAKDLMMMMDAGPVFGKAYQQYFLVTATDKNGRVVGAHDGNYFEARAPARFTGRTSAYTRKRKR